MKKSIYIGALVVLSLFLFSTLTVPSGAYWPPLYEEKDLPELLTRTCPLNITVVFIGFDSQCVNTSYLRWLLPQSRPEGIIASGHNWGSNYTFDYSFVFTNQSFRANLENYLATIAVSDAPPVPPIPLQNPYYSPGSYKYNIFYNASMVETYLHSRLAAVGALPTKGYTAVLMNLTRAWINSTFPNIVPHYYNMTYVDRDTNNPITPLSPYYGQWMLGWGGQYRFWFIDLSAGASPWSGLYPYYYYKYYPTWYLQTARPELGGFRTVKGINFLTEYVSDFVVGVVYDLFAPDLQFPARTSPTGNYVVTVLALDNCTGKLNATKPLINANAIYSALSNLMPYGMWLVNVTYVHLNSSSPQPYGSLWTTIRNAELSGVQYVDYEPIWRFLEENMGKFVTVKPGWVSIPVFVFQLKSDFKLAYEAGGQVTDPGPALSFYNMVIARHNEVTDAPWGLTQMLIHEIGHCLGLPHPFTYDWLQDFTATVMSYYARQYTYGQFDKDLLSRGHVDYYMIRAASLASAARSLLASRQTNATISNYLDLADSNYGQAQQLYDTMNYGSGVPLAQAAYTSALIAYQMAQQMPPITGPTATIYQTLTIGLLGLTGVLVLTIYFMHKRAPRRK